MTSNRPAKSSISQHSVCAAPRKDGERCTARAGPDGFCIGHSPQAQEARRKGGRNKANVARLGRLIPPRLVPVFDLLEKALGEVHTGTLEPRVASAMASLAGAMVRVITAGEMEARLRDLEQRQQLQERT